jgi:microsomal dipeptidase-like Zn-dependent dipeptidase
MKMQILEIDTQIENLINQLAEANSVTIKYVNEKITNLDNAKNSILEEVKKATINTSNIVPLEEVLDQVDKWEKLGLEKRKYLCAYFVNKIELTNEGINMDWKF